MEEEGKFSEKDWGLWIEDWGLGIGLMQITPNLPFFSISFKNY